jgi:NAD(P)-dependent dehydrogenase (short-subunit alcohol dehydrogenase family)
MHTAFESTQWALLLGGSSGFGLASAKALAKRGMSVCVVHRDRKGAMPAIEAAFEEIRSTGVGFLALNTDALSDEGRAQVLGALQERLGATGRVRVLLHSIAFGNLKPLVPPRADPRAHEARARLAQALGLAPEKLDEAVRAAFQSGEADALAGLVDAPVADADSPVLEDEDFARTVHSMGTSLATWTQAVFAKGLFAADARVLGLTSEGNEVAWRGYAAVAAAKVALESVARAIAVELGPYGVRANVLQPGVTDTPALRLIPGNERMKAHARAKNPLGRLTTPADVADVVCLLASDEARWINGALIRVDGGERVAG